MKEQDMISIKNITKIYNKNSSDIPALQDVSLKIDDGEMVAVMGTSGSGKTTLLNIIGCMDGWNEGEYFLHGRDVSKLKNDRLDKFRRQNFGFIFQQFALLKDYTVRENVELPLRAVSMPKKKRNAIVEDMLGKVGMAQYVDKIPTKLSGGQQQRCAIARALVTDAPIILADEPTGALDSKTGQEIMDLLVQLNRSGKTVIIVTHNEKIAEQTSRTIYIKDGKVVDALSDSF